MALAEMVMSLKTKSKRFDTINTKAYDDAMYQFLKTAYLRSFVADFAEGKLPDELKNIDNKFIKRLDKEASRLSSKPPYMFITVNPRKEITLSELKKAVEKCVSKRVIKDYHYCYEVRKKEEKNFVGLHCHILVYMPEYVPYQFKRSVKNTFKHICDANNPNILNFKFIPNIEVFNEKIKYLQGNKQNDKLKGVELSKEYRRLNKLEDLYSNHPSLPCRGDE